VQHDEPRAVTWSEFESIFVNTLQIDEKWSLQGARAVENFGSPMAHAFIWWPHQLAQEVLCLREGVIEDPYPAPYMEVLVRTRIATCSDEAKAKDWCWQLNHILSLCSAVWVDHEIQLVATLCVTPNGRDLIHRLAESALEQIGVAFNAIEGLMPDADYKLLFTSHPVSGERREPDEMVDIFRYGAYPSLTQGISLEDAMVDARDNARSSLIDLGCHAFRAADEFDVVVTPDGVEVAVAYHPQDAETTRYGLGVSVDVLMGAVDDFDSPSLLDRVNEITIQMATTDRTSLMGSVRHMNGSLFLHSYLTAGYLNRGKRGSVEDLSSLIVNGVIHSFTAWAHCRP